MSYPIQVHSFNYRIYIGICVITFCVKSINCCNIQLKKNRSPIRTASIFGTKVSVISWIWVVAIKILTARPTISPSPSIGIATRMVTLIASWANATTNSGVILFLTAPPSPRPLHSRGEWTYGFRIQIPLGPPLKKGDDLDSPLLKRGVRGDFWNGIFLSNTYNNFENTFMNTCIILS